MLKLKDEIQTFYNIFKLQNLLCSFGFTNISLKDYVKILNPLSYLSYSLVLKHPLSIYFKNWCDILIDIINLYFSECCKTPLLINWEYRGCEGYKDCFIPHDPIIDPHTCVFQLSGTRNGYSKWSVREGGEGDLYFENDKWIIAAGKWKVSISNTSPKCPEMVQSWSAGPDAIKGHTLVGGQIRCAVEDQALERCLEDLNDCNNVQI